MSEWHFGEIGTASAVLADGRLTVRVDGTQPAPCIDVKLAEYAREANSSHVQLGLYWRHPPEPCAAALTPFTARADVDVREVRAPTLRIYDASGYVDVRVRATPASFLRQIP